MNMMRVCFVCGGLVHAEPQLPLDVVERLRATGDGCCSIRCRAALVRMAAEGTLPDPRELRRRAADLRSDRIPVDGD